MGDSITPLSNTSPYKSAPGGIFLISFFDRHSITGGTLTTTLPSDVRLKTASNSNVITPSGYHPFTTHTGMDTGTIIEATAATHHTGPMGPAAPMVTLFSFGLTPLTGTGTLIPTVIQVPTTGTSTGEAPEALAAAPNAAATGPEIPAGAPESRATTTSTSGETVLPFMNTSRCSHIPCNNPPVVIAPAIWQVTVHTP